VRRKAARAALPARRAPGPGSVIPTFRDITGFTICRARMRRRRSVAGPLLRGRLDHRHQRSSDTAEVASGKKSCVVIAKKSSSISVSKSTSDTDAPLGIGFAPTSAGSPENPNNTPGKLAYRLVGGSLADRRPRLIRGDI